MLCPDFPVRNELSAELRPDVPREPVPPPEIDEPMLPVDVEVELDAPPIERVPVESAEDGRELFVVARFETVLELRDD